MPAHAHLSIRGLGLNRGGRWLFRELAWEIPRGTFAAIVGPSGAGKSSLLKCLAALEPADEGGCAYHCSHGCGQCALGPAHSAREWQRQLGIVFQDYRLTANNSALANVLCGRLGRYPWWQTLAGFSRRDRHEALDLLAELGLDRCAPVRTCDLSGGEQQRVALARALFQQADLLLADEPVSNLDPLLAARVLEKLRAEAHEHGRTVLCVLHDPELVARFADEVLRIEPREAGTWQLSAPHARA